MPAAVTGRAGPDAAAPVAPVVSGARAALVIGPVVGPVVGSVVGSVVGFRPMAPGGRAVVDVPGRRAAGRGGRGADARRGTPADRAAPPVRGAGPAGCSPPYGACRNPG